ncbi:MAG TPA: zinc ribbon domain-containing protein [Thermoplasmata archaeon]|nr:zinc ribbon domain-containing protein [Thermoplasmata archaeon]
MAATPVCRRCGAPLIQADLRFCPACGVPIALDFPIKHDDAIREFEHHESVLQSYRAMFVASETFTASLAATRVNVAGSTTLVTLLAAFGLFWLVIWIVVTDLRTRVARFFEEHDEEGALMRYHHRMESLAHRAGFWFFTVIFPASFAILWVLILMLAYHIVQ